MDEIAQDVGLGKASLYHYFPTKEEVIRGVVERELRQFVSDLERSLEATATAPAKLHMYAQKRSKFFGQLINLASLGEWSQWRPITRDLFSNLVAAEERLLIPVFREGRQNGELDVQEPDRVARLIVHLLHGLRMRLLRNHRPEPGEVLPDELERESLLCVDLLLKGLKRRQRHRPTVRNTT
jgi:TetR/AcrR family transcriptional repressor of mexJK operon